MKTEILQPVDAAELGAEMNKLDLNLSFLPFIEFLETQAQAPASARQRLAQYVLRQFAKHPELRQPLGLAQTAQYPHLLELVYLVLASDPLTDDASRLWGLSMPLFPRFFYTTDGLNQLLNEFKGGHTERSMHIERLELLYSLIFERFYQHKIADRIFFTNTVYKDGGAIHRQFKINFDRRFIRVEALRPLPDLNPEQLNICINDPDPEARLRALLPPDMFRFEGFSVITLEDITEQYALDTLKSVVLNRSLYPIDTFYEKLFLALKSLGGDSELHFGLLPILRVNQRLVFNQEAQQHSVLIHAAQAQQIPEPSYLAEMEAYERDPKVMYFANLTEAGPEAEPFRSGLLGLGIMSFCLVPIFFNGQLTGVAEVYTKGDYQINQLALAKLDAAMPLIAQLQKSQLDQFNARLDHVIKEKFTSLQPAVEWKFNEVAWDYLNQPDEQRASAQLGAIHFRQVYPLYGAVDIRNSTLERNLALKRDLDVIFGILDKTLAHLHGHTGLKSLDEIAHRAQALHRGIANIATPIEETRVNTFLDLEIAPLMAHLAEAYPATAPQVEAYLRALDRAQGEGYDNRRRLEASMQQLNVAIANYLDQFVAEMQQHFPFYFEKIKTDGVEYDIYLGQSLVPQRKFDLIYLKNLRLYQLAATAALATLTHSLLPLLPTRLETTQLIFVNSNPIDISFRNDERRFDVDGAYNLRYQIIKKRIDKVHLKGSDERLTQPGKIAIVYFALAEAEEYLKYIDYLQQQGVLAPDLEELDLEELQGISGLRALRVGVAALAAQQTASLRAKAKPVLV
jgi:hypothetical protein